MRQVSRSVFGEFVRAGTCPTCSGSGQLVEKQCEECKGAGRVIEERTLEVEIPAGIHDGQRIRLTGEGHSGTPGARAGDAYVEVHVRHDDRFVREGNDVYSTIDLTFTQAALGATVSVPTLEGETELTFEPGTQPGEVRVLRGRGLPVLQGFGRGNQRVLVGVTVPRQLDRGAASAAGRVRRVVDGGHVRGGRGVLRQAEERIPLNAVRRVSVDVPVERAEEARAQMLELFPQGFEEVDLADGIELVAYTDASGEERLWHVFGGVSGEDVAADWRDRWRAFHQPVRVGPLWIGPPWHEPPPDATPIVIDPGRAFGTGAHPTTQLCVELLLELEPASVVDFGCGSGVLSIVAAKLGFAPVIALDADENAVAATIANAAANGVERRCASGERARRGGSLPWRWPSRTSPAPRSRRSRRACAPGVS